MDGLMDLITYGLGVVGPLLCIIPKDMSSYQY